MGGGPGEAGRRLKREKEKERLEEYEQADGEMEWVGVMFGKWFIDEPINGEFRLAAEVVDDR